MAAHYLTDDDILVLKELVLALRNGKLGGPSRTQKPTLDVPSPEVFVAWVSTPAIPAATESDGVTTPGVGYADVYTLVSSDDGTKSLWPLDLQVQLFNLSSSGISSRWVFAERDKTGDWWALQQATAQESGIELKGLTFTSDTGSTADSDPGDGLFKWNNATQASATILYFDNKTADAVTVSTFWASLGNTGFIYLQQGDDSARWQLWKWTAAPTDGTGYRKFTVTLQANSANAIVDGKTVYTMFMPTEPGGNGIKAKWIYFTLAGALAVTDASQASCTVNDYWQGASPGSTVTVYNMPASTDYAFSGASGNKGMACYDDIEDKYRIVQLECP